MTLTLILPWFPILLGVGVGGRLLGRTRGTFLGLLCALFWVVVVQASVGPGVWSDPWTVLTVVAGATTIASMGRWSAQMPVESPRADPSAQAPAKAFPDASAEAQGPSLQRLCAVMDRFGDWLEEHRHERDPWPQFDELVRSLMYECCEATHVKPYRLAGEGEELIPLHEPEPLVEGERLPARRGIVGHVVTTGRSYVAGDITHGELVDQLARESQESVVWCFAVRQGTQRLGAVVVGRLAIPPECHMPLLRAVERLINLCWGMLSEAIQSRSALQNDPVSGLPTRSAFLRGAEPSLRDSYHQGEPAAVAAIVLEGLRDLTDAGRWDVADELVREVSKILRRKVRVDDRVGRLDGHGFLILLRRVDSELASLIVSQFMSRLESLCCGDGGRWGSAVRVRCGVAGSGTEHPDLSTLVARALSQSRRARIEGIPIASDLGAIASVGAGAAG